MGSGTKGSPPSPSQSWCAAEYVIGLLLMYMHLPPQRTYGAGQAQASDELPVKEPQSVCANSRDDRLETELSHKETDSGCFEAQAAR